MSFGSRKEGRVSNWMRNHEAAAHVRHSVRTLHRWRTERGCPWHLVGGSVMFRRDELDSWLVKHRVAVYDRRHER
jgi:hypothetical protein